MNSVRILHLEDEPLDCELIKELLRQDGLDARLERVDTFDSFKAALDCRNFNLIISDYTIPGVDPLETLRLAHRNCPEIPFLFVSGTIPEDEAIETLKLGASDYVFKHRLSRLGLAVRRALREADEQHRRKKAEANLRRLNASLEARVQERTHDLREANESLRAFAYTAAHDLRSPLRAITTFSSLALEELGPGVDQPVRSYLKRINLSALQMARLLADLLEYSKLTQAEVRLESVDLQDALSETLQLLGAEIQSRNAQISLEGAFPVITGHSATIVLILSNLISNALKFVPASVTPQIRIRAEPVPGRSSESARGGVETPEPCVRLWVRDNGIGIAPDDQEKIFGVFQRLHGKQTYPGTGLGLAIVRKGAERVGGRVGVESKPGEGSCFWVEFQLAPAEAR